MKKHPLDRIVNGPRREVGPGVVLRPGFGNTTFVGGDDGVAVVDPGLFLQAAAPRERDAVARGA